MPQKERQLRATAHHEAGHAVAAWRFGMRFKHVTLKAGDGTLGQMLRGRSPKWFKPDMDSSDRTRLRAEHDIIVSFAGQVAECKFLGRRPRFGMEGDNQSALNMATYFCSSMSSAEAYLNYCFLTSRDLVNSHWREIEAVAEALLDRESLSHEETLEVITPGANAVRTSLQVALAKPKKGKG